MKSPKEQKVQRLVKPKKDDSALTINSPKHAALRINKENERYEQIFFLNKHKDGNDDSRKSAKFLDINSPKGAAEKPKLFSGSTNTVSAEFLQVGKHKSEKQLKFKRKQEFDDIRYRIRQLQSKLDTLKVEYKKKPETAQGHGDVKKDKITISKSRSVEKMATLKPTIETDNVITSPPLKTPSSSTAASQISSFVTQVASPSQNIQCSSYTTLSFMSKMKPSSHKYYVSSIVSAFCDKIKTTFTQLCKTHLVNSLQLLTTLKKSQRIANLGVQKKLPPTNRKTIIFDLDQTLIHCNQSADLPSDEKLNIQFFTGQTVTVGINVRPFAKECLEQLAQHFEIMIFTASHQCYGNVVANYLDPTGKLIAARYFRDSCYKTNEGFYVKDLRIIDRKLQNILLIDNAAYSYAYQLENGVPIIPFYNNKNDIELRHLTSFLKGLVGAQNIAKEMCNQLRVNEYPKFSDPEELIRTLYASQIKL